MELRQLEYFVAVADEANFTRAAEKIHVAQPGVSAQIRRLERELGQRLLDRSGRSVTLTAAGAAVLPHARAALAAVEEARNAVGELAGLTHGRASIGMSPVCAPVDVPGLLAEFSEACPGIETTLLVADCDQLLGALQEGQLDVAFIGTAQGRPDRLAGRTLTDDPLVALVRTQDELAGRDSVPLAELGARKLVCPIEGSGAREVLEQACKGAGIRPRIAFESSDAATTLQLAERGLGVAVLPESVARSTAHELRILDITDPSPRMRCEVVWRAADTLSPAGRAAISFALKTLRPGHSRQRSDAAERTGTADNDRDGRPVRAVAS